MLLQLANQLFAMLQIQRRKIFTTFLQPSSWKQDILYPIDLNQCFFMIFLICPQQFFFSKLLIAFFRRALTASVLGPRLGSILCARNLIFPKIAFSSIHSSRRFNRCFVCRRTYSFFNISAGLNTLLKVRSKRNIFPAPVSSVIIAEFRGIRIGNGTLY